MLNSSYGSRASTQTRGNVGSKVKELGGEWSPQEEIGNGN